MVDKGFGSRMIATLVVGLVVSLGTGSVAAAEVHRLANGITATIHDAAEIESRLTEMLGGHKVLSHPAAGGVELASDDADWVPYDSDAVVAALAAMNGFATEVDVDVFLLPVPPADVDGSFARRGSIYLAPTLRAIHPETAAYVTTHEMGHVLTWAFLDGHQSRWDAYAALRGLTDANFAPDVRHADNAREILAEDFRYLFGGPLATSNGSIENHDLCLPDRVEGLSDLLAGFVAGRLQGPRLARSTAFPNPCNPQTTIEMVLPTDFAADGSTAVLRIFDLRGVLVRTLASDYVANGRVAMQWNGLGEDGSAVASGRYLYVIRLGALTARGSVTLLK